MISLCMIVKNEEKFLKDCLDKALPLVDEAIIVDTGSTDATLDILDSYGEKVIVRNFEWVNDFSAARNYSLDGAKGDWILILDADEMLCFNHNDLRQFLEQTSQKILNIPIYSLNDNNLPTFSAEMPRLFVNNTPRYLGKIHEQLTLNNEIIHTGTPLSEQIVHIVHYGYLAETKLEKDKKHRNINLILEEIKDNPKRAFNWYNLGVSHMANEDFEEALNAFYEWSKIKKDELPSYYVDLVLKVAVCLFELRNYTQLEQHLLDYKDDDYVTMNPDYFVRLGQYYRVIGKKDLAITNYMKAVKLGESEQRIMKLGIGSFIPKIEIARMHLRSKDFKKSYLFFMDAVFAPENQNHNGYDEFVDILAKKGQHELLNVVKHEMARTNKYSGTDLDENVELKTIKAKYFENLEAAINKNQLVESEKFINEFESIVDFEPDLYVYKGIIQLVKGELVKAYLYSLIGYRLKADNFDLIYNLAYIAEQLECYHLAYRYYGLAKDMAAIVDQKEISNKIEELSKILDY